MTFLICKTCGNTENQHRFRHPFQGTIPVEEKKDGFTLDANSFDYVSRSFCGVENCGKPESDHGVLVPEILRFNPEEKDFRVIKHDFKPETMEYRKILFVLPDETRCIHVSRVLHFDEIREEICDKTIGEHPSNSYHPFTINIDIKNLHKNDQVFVLDPDDEDTEIVWQEDYLG